MLSAVPERGDVPGERAVRGPGHVHTGARLLSAHLHSAVHGHRVQRDDHAEPAGSHQPGGRGAGGAPVLPAGEGAVLPGPQVLPLLHVRARVHGARAGAAAVPLSVRAGAPGLRGAHEQVRLPVARQPEVRVLPGARRRGAVRRSEHVGPHRAGAPRSLPHRPRACRPHERSVQVPGLAQGAPLSELPLPRAGELRCPVRAKEIPRDDVLQRGRAQIRQNLDRHLVGAVLRFHLIYRADLPGGHEALQLPRAADRLPLWVLHHGVHRLHHWIFTGGQGGLQ